MPKPTCNGCGRACSRGAKNCRRCASRAGIGTTRDAATRARLSKAAHARWERQRAGELSQEAIRRRVEAGEDLKDIAASLNVSRATVSIYFNHGSHAAYAAKKGKAKR